MTDAGMGGRYGKGRARRRGGSSGVHKLKRGDRVKVAFLREKPDDVILLHDGE